MTDNGKTFLEYVTEARITAKDQIKRYTDLSRDLSRELYKHHKDGTTPPENFEGHNLPMLDSITRKSKLTKSIVVHTGVRHDPSTIIDQDGHLHLAAFTSVSDDYSIGHKFATKQARRKDDHINGTMHPAHVISIEMKKGQYAVPISNKSTYQEEQERLLPRNTKLKIEQNPVTKTDSTGRVVHNWKAHVVSQD